MHIMKRAAEEESFSNDDERGDTFQTEDYRLTKRSSKRFEKVHLRVLWKSIRNYAASEQAYIKPHGNI